MTQGTLTMTIGGKAASSESQLDVRNPATGQVFAAVPDAGAPELEAAIGAARVAFPGWRDTPWATRAAIVNRIGETIAANAGELAGMTASRLSCLPLREARMRRRIPQQS